MLSYLVNLPLMGKPKIDEMNNRVCANIHCEGVEIPDMCRETVAPTVFVEGKPQFLIPNNVNARITTNPDGSRIFECEMIDPGTRTCKLIQHFIRKDVELACPLTIEGDIIKQR